MVSGCARSWPREPSGAGTGRFAAPASRNAHTASHRAARALGGASRRLPSRGWWRTCAGGEFVEMRLDGRGSGQSVPGGSDEDVNMDLAGQGLRQVQDAAEETVFLVVIVVGLAGRLVLKLPAAGSWHLSRRQGCPMMVVMQRRRTDVDHEVSSQGGKGNQAVARKKHHFATRWEPKPVRRTSVLPSCTHFSRRSSAVKRANNKFRRRRRVRVSGPRQLDPAKRSAKVENQDFRVLEGQTHEHGPIRTWKSNEPGASNVLAPGSAFKSAPAVFNRRRV